jgi:general stress protein YciG
MGLILREDAVAEKNVRGFAAMDVEKQREIASKGGKAAHEKGAAPEFDSEKAREAGRKGGKEVSKDRGHMAKIGRKGAEARNEQRGSSGGSARRQTRTARRGETPDPQEHLMSSSPRSTPHSPNA